MSAQEMPHVQGPEQLNGVLFSKSGDQTHELAMQTVGSGVKSGEFAGLCCRHVLIGSS